MTKYRKEYKVCLKDCLKRYLNDFLNRYLNDKIELNLNDKFEFNFENELIVWKYFCGYSLEEELKNLIIDEEIKCWKEYVYSKYGSYERDKLEEFVEYLGYLENDFFTLIEWFNGVINLIFSFAVGIFSGMFLDKLNEDVSNNTAVEIGSFYLITILIIIGIFIFLIIKYSFEYFKLKRKKDFIIAFKTKISEILDKKEKSKIKNKSYFIRRKGSRLLRR